MTVISYYNYARCLYVVWYVCMLSSPKVVLIRHLDSQNLYWYLAGDPKKVMTGLFGGISIYFSNILGEMTIQQQQQTTNRLSQHLSTCSVIIADYCKLFCDKSHNYGP